VHAQTTNRIRLLCDAALDGPTNMARDEALLQSVGAGESLSTLRLYQWDAPTISLGYFQPIAEWKKLEDPLRGLPLVRRATGGGAILHDWELTYSLTVPTAHPLVGGNPRGLYELVHAAVIATLDELGASAAPCGFTDDSGPARGPFFCFARRHALDVLVGSDKIAGSAQRRTKNAILQHGSIVLATRFLQQPTAVIQRPFEEAVSQVRASFPRHVEARAQMPCDPGDWSAGELATAAALEAKYASDDWTSRV
jgi:lipoate-protein ligase A